MKTYTTKSGQNIFDICLILYGSIEGILDLLVCNTSIDITEYGPSELKGKQLTMDTKISRGIILKYHEGININTNVIDNASQSNTPFANGDHYIEIPVINPESIIMIVDQTGIMSTFRCQLVSGTIYIDWGDFSDVDVIEPEDDITIEHIYKSSGKHEIKIYGEGLIHFHILDIRGINGIAYPTSRIYVDEFYTNNNNPDLQELITSEPIIEWYIVDEVPLDTAKIK